MGSPDNTQKKVATHPKVSVMVDTAIKTLADPKGSSLQAIYKYIGANYSVDVKKLSTYIKKYLKAAVERGDLLHPKGHGGSFKINKIKKVDSKPKAPKLKPPKVHQSSTPYKKSKSKILTKSPNKSPVKKAKITDQEVAPIDTTIVMLPKQKAKKPKVALPTKPRNSMGVSKVRKPKSSFPTKARNSVGVPAQVKKPKKLKKVNGPKVLVSPGGKSDKGITSPKPVKAAAKSTKVKKSPKPEKPPLIPKKAAAKKAPAKDEKK